MSTQEVEVNNKESIKKLYEQRLGRYQRAIALEPIDRIPIASGSNYFSEVYSGNNNQQTIYDPEKWFEAEEKYVQDFPETDVLRNNRIWAPMYDAVGCKTYKMPGRDLKPNTQFQFVEAEYMKDDEYDLFIENPTEYMIDTLIPRILEETSDKGSARAANALIKGGLAHTMNGQIMRNRSIKLQEKYGMPQPITGAFSAPFDALSDVLRGLTGIIKDMRRRPDKVKAACDVLVNEMASFALATADPLKRYPIFVPTHKAMFLSHKQFEEFYWPSFKKTLEILIDAGYTVRAYLEGDWGLHLHHFLELPKGKILCDIDTQGDVFKAKEEIGHHCCIAGGIPDALLIIGTPEEVRDKVKLLCQTVGKGGGYIINAGCNIPYDAKPENVRAMIDAVMEFGVYDESIEVKPIEPPKDTVVRANPSILTPWETRCSELGGVLGDEELIKNPWETLERNAHTFVWQWAF